MGKTAFIFPGQGAQVCGMGQDFYENSETAKAVFDRATRDHLNEELLKIWQKTKKTVIFVTHSIEEATFLSDRVLVMSARPGRVKEMVEIDLPRPRGEATRNDPKFTEYNKYLRGIIG